MPGKRKGWRTSPLGPLTLAILALLLLLAQGCATARHRSILPQALEDEVRVPGFPDDVRAWAGQPSKSFARSAVESIEQERAAYGSKSLREPAALLALSGVVTTALSGPVFCAAGAPQAPGPDSSW